MRCSLWAFFLALTLIAAPAFADRWEAIGADAKDVRWYLDTTTTTRPNANTVTCWYRRDMADGSETTRVVIRRERRWSILYDGKNSYQPGETGWKDIVPDSMMELLYIRLFR
jgi:hypothetical protein